MSTPTIIIDNEFATLRYYPDSKIVYHTFHKPIGGNYFRDILNRGVELFKEHGAYKWLSDDRNITAMSDEDTKWAIEDWSPRTIGAGWKYWAILVPDEVSGRINMKAFIDTYFEHGVRINLFSSVEKAMEWLDSVK